jgi:mannose/fructose/N-acetylgalactosamine-specific phosphotransferase system component IIC
VSAWLIVAALAAVAAVDTYDFFQGMFYQPLVIATLVGAALGSPLEGAWIGALLQLLRFSEIPVGTGIFPDLGPVAAGLAGGLLIALGGEWTFDLGLAALLVLLVAAPAATVGGLLIKFQVGLQERFAEKALSAIARPGPIRLRRFLIAGIGLSALRGVLLGTGCAALAGLAAQVAGALPAAWHIPPYALVTGMVAAGLVNVLGLFLERRLILWLAVGACLGGLGVLLP